MRFLLSFVFSLSTLTAGIHAVDSFVVPPAAGPPGDYSDNPTYKIGERIDVQWTFDDMDGVFYMEKEYPPDGSMIAILDGLGRTNPKRFTWTVSSYSFSRLVPPGENLVFNLGIKRGQQRVPIVSHYFNISLPDPRVSRTLGLTSTTAISTSTSPPPTSAIVISTSEPKSDKDADSRLSTGAVAGISVGGTIGGILMLGGLGFLCWRHLRRRDSSGQHDQDQQQAELPGEAKVELPGDNAAELPGEQWAQKTAQAQTHAQGPGGLYEMP